jgi:tetratricopeptide (TPR) repeat protein
MLKSLFDDHYQAFPTWREAGLAGLTCVHVDAHLDVSNDGFSQEALAGIAVARDREQLAAFRGNPKLPWGGFHCGNYLYPALIDGTVTTLIWVVPADFAGASLLHSARQTMQGWVDLQLDEYRGLQPVEGRVEGTLFGRRLVICTCDKLPPLSPEDSANLALDIDVDYFVSLKDDRIWQTPHQLWECLKALRPVALTVATSCEGGYTPLSHRFLGQVCLDLFGGDPLAWKEETLSYQMALEAGLPPRGPLSPDSRPTDSIPTDPEGEPENLQGEPAATAETAQEAEPAAERRRRALEDFLNQAPECFRPSVLCALGRFEEAESLDPAYRLSPFDTAGRLFQKKRFADGLACLEKAQDGGTDKSFLIAFLAVGNAQLDLTLEEISKLLVWPGLTDRDKARLLAMEGEILARSQPRKAIEVLRQAIKIEPGRAGPYHLLARYLRQLGDRDEAAKMLRKALRLARGRVSSLPMLLDAARLYDEMGQKAMARATRRELEDSDVTGFYAIQSVLDTAR